TELEQMEENYIPYSQYEAMCQKGGVSKAISQRTLIGFLHDLGLVLNYAEDLRLQETNILNPEWVTNGVYKILNNSALLQKGGVLELEMLRQILDGPDYPLDKQPFIIDMMRKFELCFDFEGAAGQRFLVPDLLSKEEPDTGKWLPPHCLGFQYHYNVLPGSIMSRFIVRSHSHISKRTYWRNGVVLKRGDNRALVKADREDRIISITIDGRPRSRREFLAVIRAEFDHIHGTIAKIEAI
ncbi:MAG: GTP-binding protein, partial [Deltaproteobacteria bacterium]|nr:GTP-binding protein [Deltaproteobacteria bacterium]